MSGQRPSRGQQCDDPMGPWENGVDDMAAIELTAGKQVQRSDHHADPGGEGYGMDIHTIERQQVYRSVRKSRKHVLHNPKNEGMAELWNQLNFGGLLHTRGANLIAPLISSDPSGAKRWPQ